MHLLLIVVYCFNKRRALPGRVYLNQSFMVEVNLLNALSPGFVISEIDLSQQVPTKQFSKDRQKFCERSWNSIY